MADEVQGREHLLRRQQVLTAIFKRFQVYWRNAFAPTLWPAMLETWMDDLEGVPTDVLDQAARDVLRTQPKYPPKVWDLVRAAERYRTDHAGPVYGPGSAARSRVWVWGPPVAPRIVRIERRDDGTWLWPGLVDGELFYGLGDEGRIEYCEAQAREYQQRMRASGHEPLVA